MRMLKIDAEHQEITEIDIEPTLENMQELVGGLIEVAINLTTAKKQVFDYIYVDEEGLFKSYSYGFRFENYGGSTTPILMGNGFVAGVDFSSGETVAATISLEELKTKIEFYTCLIK